MTYVPRMVALLNEKIYDDRPYATVLIVGLLIAGLMSMVIGLYYLNFISTFMTVDDNTYNMAKLIMMFFVMVIGAYALYKGYVLEGLFLLFVGMATFIFAATNLVGAADGLMIVDILVGTFLLLFAVGFYLKGDLLLCVASVLMGIGGTFYSLFSGDALFLLIGLGCFLSGLVEIIYVILTCYELSFKPESFPWRSSSIGRSKIRSAGYPIVAMLLILVSTYYLNSALGFTTMDAIPYNIAKTVISLLVLMIAVLAFRQGDFNVGLLFLLAGSSTLTFSISFLTGNGTGLELLDFFLGVSALIAVGMAYKNKEWDFALAAFLFFLSTGLYIFLSGDAVYFMVGIPMLASGLVFLLSGIRNILRSEVSLAI